MRTNISPIKRNTELLFYNQPNTKNYKVFSIKKGMIGEFTVEKRNELFINHLYIEPDKRRQGYGAKILDFISGLSKKEGLNGKMRVLASLLDNEKEKPPHIFYRKYGFTANDKQALSEIDKHIFNKKQLPQLFKPLYMFFIPPKI